MEGQLLAGRYEILGHLGDGGVATVWRAMDREIGAEVAIKVLHAHLARDPIARERLRREVLAARRVAGEGVVGVHELHVDQDRVFVVQDLAGGGDLQRRLDAEGPQPVDRVAGWARSIAIALQRAHAAGVVHRDVKPANVLLDGAGHARLADFGLARVDDLVRATATSQLAGSLGYTAPEVLRGVTDDPRSDQYALAVTLYALLVGRTPFDDDHPAAALRRQLEEDPPRADLEGAVPGPVADVLARGMARRAEDRFPTVAAFAEALDRAVGGIVPEPLPASKACAGCGEPLVPGLPACPRCGRTRVLAPRSPAGAYEVHVYPPLFRRRSFGRGRNPDRLTFVEKRTLVETVQGATGAELVPADGADAALGRTVVVAADHLDPVGADLIATRLAEAGLEAHVVGPGRSGRLEREWLARLFPFFPFLILAVQAVVIAMNGGGGFAALPLAIGLVVSFVIRSLLGPRPLLAPPTAAEGGAVVEAPLPAGIRDAMPGLGEAARDALAEVLRAVAAVRASAAEAAPVVRDAVESAALEAAESGLTLARRLSALDEGRPSRRSIRDPAADAAEAERAQAAVETRHRLLELAAELTRASTALHRGAVAEASTEADAVVARLGQVTSASTRGQAEVAALAARRRALEPG